MKKLLLKKNLPIKKYKTMKYFTYSNIITYKLRKKEKKFKMIIHIL